METYTYKLVEDEHGNIQCGDKLYRFEEIIGEERKPIVEENKIPEKLNIELNSSDENKVNYYRATNLECDLAFKINSIIDYLKSKGE